MKLHFRGIQVPALGSPRDIVYRQYLGFEAKVEAKKHKLALLTAIATPTFSEDSGRRAWEKQAKTTFDEYIMLMLGKEELPEDKEETKMQKFYDEVIKNSSPKLSKDSEGKLIATDLPRL